MDTQSIVPPPHHHTLRYDTQKYDYTKYYRIHRRENPRLLSWDESPSSSVQTLKSQYLGAPRAYIRPSTRRFPRRVLTPHKLAVDSVFAPSKSKPVGCRPTENNQVTPSPVRDGSNGGVAPSRVCRTRNRKSPNEPPVGGRGKPTTSVVGGCHLTTVTGTVARSTIDLATLPSMRSVRSDRPRWPTKIVSASTSSA